MHADVWTVNERRVFTGMDPLPDNDPRGDRIAGLLDFSQGLAGLSSASAPAPAIATKHIGAEVWSEFDIGTKSLESTWTISLQAGLALVRDAVVKGVSQVMIAAASDAKMDVDRSRADAALAAVNEVVTQAMQILQARVARLVLGTGSQAVRRLSSRIGVSFSRLEPGLTAYAQQETAFLVRVMGETTARSVASAVQASLDRGDTIRQLAKELGELPDFSRARAQTVARTETTRAWNGAQRRTMSEFARDTGGGVRKTWLTSQDDRVRDEHVALEGVQVGIDDLFPNGLQEPSEPNCRCTLIYEVVQTGESIEEGQP